MRKLQALGGAAALLAALLLGGCSQTAVPATPEQAATAAPEATAEPAPAPSTNPLTGLDDGNYTGKRPVAVTLRTLDGAQPQWGVASADVLVEGVTEGSTTGLTAIFADVDSISKVGPVGAGRDLFLQVALPLNAVPVSIDKNIYASNLLNTLGYQDLDGYHIGKAAFAFDQGRQDAGYREENCWYTTGELIRTGLTNYGASAEGDNTPLFRFGTRPEVNPENRNGMNLTVTFSKSDSEQLNYNTGTGLYEKLNADGSPMTDADNGQQVGFTNVFVLYASSGIKDDGYTRQYDMTGGTGLYLQGGAWEQINWTKEDATGPFTLTDADGAPLTVAPGKSFVAIWGGYYGQGLTLTAADGSEQTLPEKPVLLESGVSDEAAAAAEEELSAAQRIIDTRQYDMTGGTGLYLQGGAWEQINWTKEDATGPFTLTDADGAPLTVAPGKSFVAIWGGYYGQGLTLTAADGSEQTLPEKPVLLESGVSDEAAAAAEEELSAAQRIIDAQAAVDQAKADLADALDELQEAQAACDADSENADLLAARDAVQAKIDELNQTIADNQAILDAAAPEGTPAPEEEQPAESESETPAE